MQDPILDAARDSILAVGLRRTTVSDVARRAGLSRMTVYRRYPDGAQLIRALMWREFGGLLEQVQDEVAGQARARDRLVTATVRIVERLAEHPLMRRLLEHEPEVLLPYVTVSIGRFQAAARELVAAVVAEGQEDGTIRDGDPDRIAAAIESAARGPALALSSLRRSERRALLAELRDMLDAYLRPVE
jgi:AcrR family transcriptional regulator